MASVHVTNLWHAILALTPAERQELRSLLASADASVASGSSAGAVAANGQPGESLDRLLLQSGVLTTLPAGAADVAAYQNWKPIEVKGKPVSQTIIDERR